VQRHPVFREEDQTKGREKLSKQKRGRKKEKRGA
jgi:hypothetical protein